MILRFLRGSQEGRERERRTTAKVIPATIQFTDNKPIKSKAMKTKEQLIENIIVYAKKVVMYPVGSKGYDPADMINLTYAVNKYNEWQVNH
jgi:hypothetical protein